MTELELMDIAEKHAQYRDANMLTLRGQAIIDALREVEKRAVQEFVKQVVRTQQANAN